MLSCTPSRSGGEKRLAEVCGAGAKWLVTQLATPIVASDPAPSPPSTSQEPAFDSSNRPMTVELPPSARPSTAAIRPRPRKPLLEAPKNPELTGEPAPAGQRNPAPRF